CPFAADVANFKHKIRNQLTTDVQTPLLNISVREIGWKIGIARQRWCCGTGEWGIDHDLWDQVVGYVIPRAFERRIRPQSVLNVQNFGTEEHTISSAYGRLDVAKGSPGKSKSRSKIVGVGVVKARSLLRRDHDIPGGGIEVGRAITRRRHGC